MSFKITAISGIKWTTVEKIGKSIFQLLQVAILTRFLSKEAFGLIALSLLVINFSKIFVDLGLTTAILHHQKATVKEYSSIYWLNIIISSLIFIVLLVLTPLFSAFYGESELLKIIPILSINVLIISIGTQHRTLLQRDFSFEKIAKIELLSIICGLITAVTLAIKGFGVYSLVYSTLVNSAIANFLFVITNVKTNPIELFFSFKDTKPFIKVGGYQMGSSLIGFFSKEIDILIIGKLLSAEVLGAYSLSKQIVLKIYKLINPIVTNVLSPLLSSIQSQEKKLRESYLKMVRYLAYSNFPIYLTILIFSKDILYYVYGESYSEYYLILSFISIYYCISTISNPVGSLQVATGRTDLGFIWTIFRLITTPIIFYYSAKLYGIQGVAISHTFLAIFLIIPMWFIQVKPMVYVSLSVYLSQFYKPMLIYLGLISLFLYNELFLQIEDTMSVLFVKMGMLSMYTVSIFIIDRESSSRLLEITLSLFNLKR